MNSLRNQFFIAGVAGLFISGFASLIVDRSTAPHAEPIDFAIAHQRDLAARHAAAVASEDSAREIESLQKNASLLDTLLPSDPKIDPLLQQICQLASLNSLHVNQINPLPSRPLATAIDQPVAMAVSGNFNGFYSFLLQLEALPRLKRMSHVQLHKSPDHNGEVQANLTMDVYSDLSPQTPATPG
jgi:Tfp pilus assembly protein PilO